MVRLRHLFPVCCIALASSAAQAAPAVDAAKCPALRAGEVARILELELSTLTPPGDSIPAFSLSLACSGPELRMTLLDPATDKKLERAIPAPLPADPSRERVVALAASQLLVASWLELLSADPPRSPALPPPQMHAAKGAARRAINAESASRRYELGLGGGLVLRALRRPVLLGTVALPSTLWILPRLGARVEVAWEDGSTERATGTVRVRVASASLGLAGRLPVAPRLSLETFALAGIAHVIVSGHPSTDAYEGHVGTASTAVLQAGAGPVLTWNPLTLSASVRAGALMLAPPAPVADDREVRVAGAQFAFVLSASIAAGD